MSAPSQTFLENVYANALLGVGMVMYLCLRDFCKRVSHSDCYYDQEHGGLKIKLPTWRADAPEDVSLEGT